MIREQPTKLRICVTAMVKEYNNGCCHEQCQYHHDIGWCNLFGNLEKAPLTGGGCIRHKKCISLEDD